MVDAAASGAPAGYRRLEGPRGARIVALSGLAQPIARLLDGGTLYELAARLGHGPDFHGRAPAYGLRIDRESAQPAHVVVRHNWHGGALARLTGDRFLGSGRTALELDASVRLRDAGVPTPRVVATVTYPAGMGFSRADVATELILDSRDLASCLEDADLATRQRALAATGGLLDLLSAAGARHHDLNAKNVLIHAPSHGEWTAYVLDVDRVRFLAPHDISVTRGNVERLLRSIGKRRRLNGALVTDGELAGLRDRCIAASRP